MPPPRPRRPDPLEDAIEAALDPGRFIRYGAGWSFVDGLEQVEERIAKLVRGAPARAVTLYETFLAGAFQKAEEVDGSSGDFGTFVGALFRGWVRARQAAGADPDATARRLVEWSDDDPYGFCYRIEHELVKVLDRRGLAAFAGVVRERFDGKAPPAPGPDGRRQDPEYTRRRAAEILRAVLAKQGDLPAYAALCEATGLSPEDCLAQARMAQAQRTPAEALTWVERGLALEKKGRSSSAEGELAELRRALLLKLGRCDDALADAWAAFRSHPHRYSYADLMRYVPKPERRAWHAKAMDASARADLQSLVDLCLATREIDRLADRLREARDEEIEAVSHYTTEPAAKRLAETHAGVAARVYRALGVRILQERKSKLYDAALAHFAQARRCYERAGLTEGWEGLVREVRGEHHRKKGFMAAFEDLAAGNAPRAEPPFLERAKARWLNPQGAPNPRSTK
jgi:tetratricopeptide (TPR) repeat protein